MRSGIMARDGADLARSNHCRCNILLAALVRSNGHATEPVPAPRGNPRLGPTAPAPAGHRDLRSVTSPPRGSIELGFRRRWLSPHDVAELVQDRRALVPRFDQPGGLGSCELSTIQPLTNCRGSSGAVRGRATAANACPFPENGMSVWPGDVQAMTTGAQRLA